MNDKKSLKNILNEEYTKLKEKEREVATHLFHLLPDDLEEEYEKDMWGLFLSSVNDLYGMVHRPHYKIINDGILGRNVERQTLCVPKEDECKE